MTHIKFDYSKVLDKFVAPHELDYMQPQVTAADNALRNGTGPGAEMTCLLYTSPSPRDRG